jgi:hypothetical protein
MNELIWLGLVIKDLREMVWEPFKSTLQYHFLPQVKQHKSIIELFFIPPIGLWSEMKMMKNDNEPWIYHIFGQFWSHFLTFMKTINETTDEKIKTNRKQ